MSELSTSKRSSFDEYRLILKRCFDNRENQKQIDAETEKALQQVLVTSTHKTYKYVCISGLLGKVVDNFNPIALQEGANVERSWDARSVCHNVLVPFERKYLDGRLGASNEPFLNKPARFETLSLDNAVRSGKDKEVLETLVSLFRRVDTMDSFAVSSILSNALKLVMTIPTMQQQLGLGSSELVYSSYRHFVDEVLSENIGGTCLVFVTAISLRLVFDSNRRQVITHKLNQSGASSKEVCDIDIIDSNSNAVGGFEIKDKSINETDIQFAKHKTDALNVPLLFVSRQALITEFLQKGVSAYSNCLLSIESLVACAEMNLDGNDDLNQIISTVLEQMNPKVEFITHLKNALARLR
jgi:hypothetical protein